MAETKVVAGRYAILEVAGSGGMGTVYRARDEETGEVVAVKLLSRDSAVDDVRFQREAALLAGLKHPAIVGYRAHGHTEDREGFLVMEWLEGELLSDRIRRESLTVEETIAVGQRVAEALAQAHSRGVVHRDIKPSNLLLVGGEPEGVKLIDFGVARHTGPTDRITATGAVVGTPDYMAPEQVRGEADLDSRVDVFALGAVMFQLLTGQPPFLGDGVMAVLVKILLADTPYVSDLRGGVPLLLDDLVGRMLSKERDDRPADGRAVADTLAALAGEEGEAPRVAPRRQRDGLTTREQRLLCIVMVHGPSEDADAGGTMDSEYADGAEDAIRQLVADLGGRLELLADGGMVAAIVGRGTPTDHAIRAARCALGIRQILTEAPIALVAGRGELKGRIPIGEVVDRGMKVLRAARMSQAWRVGAGVRIDDLVAGLLDRRFEVKVDEAGRFLAGEIAVGASPRLLRGKPTTCVGRDRELATLAALYEECVEEPAARAALVTGPAGAGKSRVLHELLAQLAAEDDPPLLLVGRGEPERDGSPFALIAGVIREHAGVTDSAPEQAACGAIVATVRSDLGPEAEDERVMRTAEFLGQLARVHFPSAGRETLKAARADAVLMGDQLRTAWEEWLRGRCAHGPVLLVIDDLQWSDLPSISFLDGALRRLADQPFMVLALARPEVSKRYPDLWSRRAVQQIALAPLRRKAALALAAEVLGADADLDSLAPMIERAGGNPFYLEELLRALADGASPSELPDSVLGMVQARLDSLDVEERRTLRAAAVFGRRFVAEGVAKLLGHDDSGDEVGRRLDELREGELITVAEDDASKSGTVYAFRHALVQQGAYAMLTAEDRVLGRRLAGEWLEETGHSDPVTLASHYESGGTPERALRWFHKAAVAALDGNDYITALEHTERALGYQPDADDVGRLRLIQAEALRWSRRYDESAAAARRALETLPAGSDRWYQAVAEGVSARTASGDAEAAGAAALSALSGPRRPGDLDARVTCLCRSAALLLQAGRTALAEELAAAAEELVASAGGAASTVLAAQSRAWFHVLQSQHTLRSGDPTIWMRQQQRAIKAFMKCGDARRAATQRMNLGFGRIGLGDFAGAEELLRQAKVEAERLGLSTTAAYAQQNLGQALLRQGRLDEAEAEMRGALAAAGDGAGGDRLAGVAHTYLAELSLEREDQVGNLAVAREHAAQALRLLGPSPGLRGVPHVMLARTHLSGSADAPADPGAALAETTTAMNLIEIARLEEGEGLVRLTHAQALAANGAQSAANDVLGVALARLQEEAAGISDSDTRERFLEQVPENRAVLALAREWELTEGA